jgi:DNA-binding CsgD family transcriptional regulator
VTIPALSGTTATKSRVAYDLLSHPLNVKCRVGRAERRDLVSLRERVSSELDIDPRLVVDSRRCLLAQHGQVLRLKARRPDGKALWAYRYRMNGRRSKRPQVGGFATRAEAERAQARTRAASCRRRDDARQHARAPAHHLRSRRARLRRAPGGRQRLLLKDAGPGELLHAIRIVAAGEALLAPSVTRRLVAEFAARPDPQTPPPELAELTEREREVLQLVAAGLSNADIARRLVISPLTAKTHVARILAKLDCHDRAQLVALAYETGLVTPGVRQTETNDAA